MKTKPLNYDNKSPQIENQIELFGLLLIFDLDLNCVAISQNCTQWFNTDHEVLLTKDLHYFNQFLQFNSSTELDDLLHTQGRKHKVTLNNQLFLIHLYQHENHLFLELEKCYEKEIEFSQITDFQYELDNSDDIWQTLSENFYSIFGFDRIIVYKFKDQSTATVIAEKNEGNLNYELSFLNNELNSFNSDKSSNVRESLSQIIGFSQESDQIIYKNSETINLKKTDLPKFSKDYLYSLKKNQIKTSASFSIVIENRLWGVVCCHNIAPKYISKNQKSLASFVINYASSRYIINKQNFLFFQKEFINDIELEIKERFLLNENLEQTISSLSSRLLKLLSADGLILKSSKSTSFFGETPNSEEFKSIENFIKSKENHAPIFYSDNYDSSVSCQYSAVACLQLNIYTSHSIFFFKSKKYIEEIQSKNGEVSNLNFPPHTDIEVWEKIVKKVTPKWSKFEINYLQKLHELISQSIDNRSSKITELTHKLDEANTKLETYTYQIGHDILSPLTTIKISAEFIQSHSTITEENIKNYTDTILDAGKLINNIISQTIQNASSRSLFLENQSIEVDTFIKHIIDQAVSKYKIENFDLKLGNLLPVTGEKTLLYQLFLNLINNSIKFSSKQKVTKLNIYSVLEDKKVVYYIKDNGIGISECDQENIFKIFQRSSNSLDYEGSGVGMSIVKRITEQLNIQILFKSKINLGTTFILKFP